MNRMKALKYFLVFSLLWLLLPVSGQVTYRFETGDVSNCWIFKEIEVAPKKVTPIAGLASGITRALNVDPSSNAVYLASPWIKLAPGNITFKTQLTTGSTGSQNSRGYKVSYIEYNAASGNTFVDAQFIQFFTYSYNPIATDLRTVTVPVPASIAGNGKSYRIVIGFFGLGGSAQSVIDDISIPGLYNSNAVNNCLPITTVIDADSDGVADVDDAYPTDPTRAFNNYFPSATGFATLLFEDLWPKKGDYDFNDLVMGYRINTVTNASDKVVNQVYTFKVRAIGAGLHNGFGFQVGSVAPSSVVAVTGTHSAEGFTLLPSGLEAEQTKATVIVFDDAYRYFESSAQMVNTEKIYPEQPAATVTVNIAYQLNLLTVSQVDVLAFNPFLIINADRTREIHLANHLPTDLINRDIFQSFDDNSLPSTGKYYTTSQNLPWGLNIPYEVKYPIERTDFNSAYLKFAAWALSGGTAYTDWYLDLPGYQNGELLY